MNTRRGWRMTMLAWLLGAGLAGSSGCLSFTHPVGHPRTVTLEACHALPKCCRGHVYVFLVNGNDPPYCGNLPGVRNYLIELGFTKTYHAEMYHYYWLKKEIRRIHEEDPEARFALVGFSLGGNSVLYLAEAVQKDNIQIDLLVYLDRKPMKNDPRNKPANVARVVNILANDLDVWKGEELDGAENVYLEDSGHFGSPTHPITLETLADELMQVAGTVPVTLPADPELPPIPENAPTPRPYVPTPSAQRGEWDFLKPATALGHWPDEQPAAVPAAKEETTEAGPQQLPVGPVSPTASQHETTE